MIQKPLKVKKFLPKSESSHHSIDCKNMKVSNKSESSQKSKARKNMSVSEKT
jgi:hypothetical protein